MILADEKKVLAILSSRKLDYYVENGTIYIIEEENRGVVDTIPLGKGKVLKKIKEYLNNN